MSIFEIPANRDVQIESGTKPGEKGQAEQAERVCQEVIGRSVCSEKPEMRFNDPFSFCGRH